MSKLNSPIHPQCHPTNKPSFHFKFIKTGNACINRSHSQLKSHFNQENLWRWMHCHIWKTQSCFNKTQWKYYWRLLVSNEQIMALPITWSIPSQTTIQHDNTQLKNTKTQANTGVNISKQWHWATPGHITQHSNDTYLYFTIRLSATQKNGPCSRQSMVGPSKHGKVFQKN